jgi:excinuclease ABC subunit C
MTVETVKSQLKNIPQNPGVYQFFDEKDRVLYVGKAKNLLKRVTSYTKERQLSARISRMVFLAQRIEIIQTENEVEALLLEHNLIKKLEPKFNILLRDDKTFPQILISDHKFPQITKYRGVKLSNGSHFGPFASAHDVNKTIDVLRKSFLLRNCSDAEFKSRKKPCLEYQIRRCSAPCVGLISQDEYQTSVDNACNFLSGKSAEVQKKLVQKMQQLSGAHEYEKAAVIRDQLRSLNSILTKQNINVDELKDFDAITVMSMNDKVCAYISFYRGGQNFGARPYFYDLDEEKNLSEFLAEFLGQFYLAHVPPSLILLNVELVEKKLMEEFLCRSFCGSWSPDPDLMFASKENEIVQVEYLTQTCGRGRETPSSAVSGMGARTIKKVEILTPKKGAKFALIKDQEQIALQNLEQKIAEKFNNKELLFAVKNIFNLAKIPQRIEVYDNSHISGTNAVGALISAGADGFIKSGYRKFNIRFDIGKGRDDTSMLQEVLTRRFSKLKKEEWPDFIIIDGGKGQLSATQRIFEELKVEIPFTCMSKGENRNAGEEFFHRSGAESFTLPKHHPAMHYLQRLRDEAHRFAIMTHRKKRQKNFINANL